MKAKKKLSCTNGDKGRKGMWSEKQFWKMVKELQGSAKDREYEQHGTNEERRKFDHRFKMKKNARRTVCHRYRMGVPEFGLRCPRPIPGSILACAKLFPSLVISSNF
jgi:hypothetical protein